MRPEPVEGTRVRDFDKLSPDFLLHRAGALITSFASLL
jgi:hypothetical protein